MLNKLDFLNIPLFQDLDRIHKAKLLPEFTQISFRAGEVLFEEGEFGDSLYIIMQGEVRIYLQSQQNRTLALLGESEYFGEMSLLTGDPRSAAAKAETELVVLRLGKERFEALLLSQHSLAVQFAGILARRLAAGNKQASGNEPVSGSGNETAVSWQLGRNESDGSSRPPSAVPVSKEQQASVPIRAADKAAELLAGKDAGRYEWPHEEGKGDEERSFWSRLMLWGASIGSAWALYGFLSRQGLHEQEALLYAIVAAGFLLLVLRLAALPVVSLLMVGGLTAGGLLTSASGLVMFAQWPFAAAVLFSAGALLLDQAGLPQRLVMLLAARSARQPRLGLALGALLELVWPLLLPSSERRQKLVASAAAEGGGLAELLRSRLSPGLLFVQSSMLCWFALAMLSAYLPGQTDSAALDWLWAAWPLALVLLALRLTLALLPRSASATGDEGKRRAELLVQAQLEVIGPWSARETVLVVLPLVSAALLLAGPYLSLSPIWAGAVLLLGLSATGLWSRSALQGLRLDSLVAFGLLAAVAHAALPFIHDATFTAVLGRQPAALMLVLLLAVVCALRGLLPALPAIMYGLLMLAPAAMRSGADPLLIAITAVAGSQLVPGRLSLRLRRGWLITTAAGMVAIVIAIPVWQAQGRLQAPLSIPALSTDAGKLSDEVQTKRLPFLVVVPDDTAEAAAMRQGIEQTLQQLELTGDVRQAGGEPLELYPVYTTTASLDEASGAEALFGIAYRDTGNLSWQLPWLLTEEAASTRYGSSVLWSGSILPSAEDQAKAAAEVLHQDGLRRIALYYEPSPAGREFADRLEAALRETGIRLVDRLLLLESQGSLPMTVLRWEQLGADAVLAYDSHGEASHVLLQQLKEHEAELTVVQPVWGRQMKMPESGERRSDTQPTGGDTSEKQQPGSSELRSVLGGLQGWRAARADEWAVDQGTSGGKSDPSVALREEQYITETASAALRYMVQALSQIAVPEAERLADQLRAQASTKEEK